MERNRLVLLRIRCHSSTIASQEKDPAKWARDQYSSTVTILLAGISMTSLPSVTVSSDWITSSGLVSLAPLKAGERVAVRVTASV